MNPKESDIQTSAYSVNEQTLIEELSYILSLLQAAMKREAFPSARTKLGILAVRTESF